MNVLFPHRALRTAEARVARLSHDLAVERQAHETTLRALDAVRSRLAAFEAVEGREHRNCVSPAVHLAVVHELDRATTVPRTGGAP